MNARNALVLITLIAVFIIGGMTASAVKNTGDAIQRTHSEITSIENW
jgi:Flp pilus assembly pilin Flp